MERITSFSVDHRKLTKGVYVSRIDGDLITYDIRMTQPNVEPALKPEAAHTIEHIGATLLRNGKYKDQVIYFGPMGCMTGFYLIVRDLDLEVIKEVVKDTDLAYILLETDSPYLAPVPHRGEDNNPKYIPIIADEIASIKWTSSLDIARVTTANAEAVFDFSCKK